MKVVAMRNNDKLEDFISQNKSAFDNSIPSLKVWGKIENALDEKMNNQVQNRGKKNFIWLGLFGLLLIIMGMTYYTLINREEKPKQMLFAEVENLENFYEYQSHKLIKSVNNDFSILRDPDLQDIESHIAEIKQDLGVLPIGSEEQALKALLDSYKTKLMIIERILEQYQLSKPLKIEDEKQNI